METTIIFLIQTFMENSSMRWHKLITPLRDVLKAAIRAQIKFNYDEFERLYRSCQGSEWMNGGCGVEEFYKTAIQACNRSARRSFENWKARKAFITTGSGRPEFIYVNKTFVFQGKVLICASFDDLQGLLIAHEFEDITVIGNYNSGQGKVLHTFMINHEQLEEENGKT